MRQKTEAHKPTEKAKILLAQYQLPLIEELGARAYELLTPREVAEEIFGKKADPEEAKDDAKKLPELLRQGWLAKAPGKDIGSAFQYYRWRVEFVKRYKGSYKRRENTNLETHRKMAKIGHENT